MSLSRHFIPFTFISLTFISQKHQFMPCNTSIMTTFKMNTFYWSRTENLMSVITLHSGRWDVLCTYHSISFACLLGLVKTSASRGGGTHKNRRQTNVRWCWNAWMCLKVQQWLWEGGLLWMQRGCSSVNKPTSRLFSTSSMSVRASRTAQNSPMRRETTSF